MKPTLTVACLILLNFAVHSQQYVDLVKVEHTQSARISNPGRYNYQETMVDILVPIVLSENSALLIGTLSDHSIVRPGQETHLSMQSTLLKIGMNIKHSDKFSATYLLLPKCASRRIAMRADQFQIGGLVLIKRHYSENFNIKGGLYVNREFFGSLLVPIAGFYYTTGRFEMNFALPINAEMSYALVPEKFRIGGRFDGINRSYAGLDSANRYLEKTNNEIGVFAEAGIGNIKLRLFVGHSFWRKFTSYAQSDKVALALPAYKPVDNRTVIREIKPDGMLVKASVFYRLPIQ